MGQRFEAMTFPTARAGPGTARLLGQLAIRHHGAIGDSATSVQHAALKIGVAGQVNRNIGEIVAHAVRITLQAVNQRVAWMTRFDHFRVGNGQRFQRFGWRGMAKCQTLEHNLSKGDSHPPKRRGKDFD